MRMRDWIVRVLQLLWLDLCLGAVGHNGEFSYRPASLCSPAGRYDSTFVYGGVHTGARSLHILNLIWLNISPIPVGRRGVISSF
jgi:hypothetical protein